jgi:hypothetical protein
MKIENQTLRFVHPLIGLDYKHNCSVLFDPAKGYDPIVSCLTDQAEIEMLVQLGIYNTIHLVSNDNYCEWCYFWMDRIDFKRF